MTDRPYSPNDQMIAHLLDQCEQDWGNPQENRVMLLPTGIGPLDKALYGLNTIEGEIILVQGPEKQRKSTLVANVVTNYMLAPKPETKPMTVIDTLESGMSPQRYRDFLISMVATQVLFTAGHVPGAYCPECQSPTCLHMGVNPDFLRYNTRTEVQKAAISEALQLMKSWPLMIFGAAEHEGNTRSLAESIVGTRELLSRWKYLIDEFDAKVFITDHLQQYSFESEQLGDYEKQLRTIAAVSDIVASRHIVNLLISQVSLTSQREAMSGTGKYTASGGRKAAAEANSIISVNYDGGSSEVTITLEDCRKASPFSMYTNIEPSSGRFYGNVNVGKKAQYRAGMEDGASGKGKYRGRQ